MTNALQIEGLQELGIGEATLSDRPSGLAADHFLSNRPVSAAVRTTPPTAEGAQVRQVCARSAGLALPDRPRKFGP
jgi:hypothetical protein